jgi:hypothetical protein
MSPATGVRVCVCALFMTAFAVPAAAQVASGPTLAIGTALKYGSETTRKNWLASLVVPVGGLISIEVEGLGSYYSAPAESYGPGLKFFGRSHGALGGIRVTPPGSRNVRAFGHFLVGARFDTLRIGASYDAEENFTNKLSSYVVMPGGGVDIGNRRIAARLQIDRTFERLNKATFAIGDDSWLGVNRVSAFVVIGIGGR